MNDEREKHLEESLLLDAEHKGARAALGYTKVDGRWVLPEEHMRSLGYVRFEGGWRLPQEIEIRQREGRIAESRNFASERDALEALDR